ncbi:MULTISPECIES: AraC family transcriptional regulator [Streptococcus]|uniref:AraC family transcriptional regulator n=1 Tax=Streptococcus TaxID=1301 RepID=UPI0012DC3B52|nr:MULTISPECIES: AraC family transcriptional regulator [Streptococcus]QHF54551.1 AraC family transcriptional regulator [Streptococcus sp. DAT741]
MLFSELNTDTSDLSIDFYGYEDCAPSYSFGPAIRDNYVLHYITKGKGIFYYNNQEIHLSAGDLFLLKPNEVTFYQADKRDPWSYYWIGMGGNKSQDYIELSSIGIDAYLRNSLKKSTSKVAQQIIKLIAKAESRERTTRNQLELFSQAYKLLFELSRASPNLEVSQLSQAEKICQECRHMIEMHYNIDGLSISTIAEDLNVNRSYLTTLFKKFHHVSPKEYLLQVRMRRAKQLLEGTEEPIKVIAYSVGFMDPLYFSKVFRDFYHMSPSQCRKTPLLSVSK